MSQRRHTSRWIGIDQLHFDVHSQRQRHGAGDARFDRQFAQHDDAAFGISRRRNLIIASEALKDTNARFSTALAHMSQGLCMFDAAHRIVVANDRYRELFQLPAELIQPGTNLAKILDYRIAAGNYGGPALNGDVTAYFNHSYEFQEILKDGKVVLTTCGKTIDFGFRLSWMAIGSSASFTSRINRPF